jgi:RNA polymerase sigma factor (TIGR02999 family)
VGDVTRIIEAAEAGDARAASELLPIVYDELRRPAAQRLSQERPGQTLQATALVHEAYVRLVDAENSRQWHSRGHFFAAAAEAMRRILINHARDKKRLKRGGDRQRVDFDQIEIVLDGDDQQLLELNDALEHLATDEPRCAQLVKLRFFAGLTLREAAESMGLPQRTAEREWAYARAWLFDKLFFGGLRRRTGHDSVDGGGSQ